MKVKNPCIYVITNTYTGKVYVGSTLYLQHRFSEHVCQLKAQRHHNPYLQKSWNKHGEARFNFSVLEHVADETELTVRESYWIAQYKATDRGCGYNIYTLNERGRNILSADIKQKISDAHKHKVVKDSTKEKIRAANEGKKASVETRQKMSAVKQGVPHSPERIAAMANAHATTVYDFTHKATGQRFNGTNIARFARDNGLSPQNLYKVVHGKRNFHKGWYLTENNNEQRGTEGISQGLPA